jgi:hypothetical protein
MQWIGVPPMKRREFSYVFEWLYPWYFKKKSAIFVRILSLLYLLLAGALVNFRDSDMCNGFEQVFASQVILGFLGFLSAVEINSFFYRVIIFLSAFMFTAFSGLIYMCGDVFSVFYFFTHQYKISGEILWMFMGMGFYLTLLLLVWSDRKKL